MPIVDVSNSDAVEPPYPNQPIAKVTKAHDGFCLVGKALIVDSHSDLVAYLKCHYCMSCCGCCPQRAWLLIMTTDMYACEPVFPLIESRRDGKNCLWKVLYLTCIMK